MNLKTSFEDEWSEVTRGERYIIRTTSEETKGAY